MRYLSIIGFLLIVCSLYSNWSLSGELTHYDIVKAGQRLSRNIEIQNQGSEDLILMVKQADYAFNSEGKRWFVEAGKLKRSNAQWIDLGSQEIVIRANSTYKYTYRINIPEKQELSGSYWSLIFIQEKTDSSSDSLKNNLKINQRYAIQSINQIQDTGSYNIEFLEAEFSKDNNNFQLKIKNTGERWVKAEVWIEVYDQEGNKIGKYIAEPAKLYPETSTTCKIPLTAIIKKQKYFIVAVVDCGNNKIFGSQYTLEK